jgi:hypothetical protein
MQDPPRRVFIDVRSDDGHSWQAVQLKAARVSDGPDGAGLTLIGTVVMSGLTLPIELSSVCWQPCAPSWVGGGSVWGRPSGVGDAPHVRHALQADAHCASAKYPKPEPGVTHEFEGPSLSIGNPGSKQPGTPERDTSAPAQKRGRPAGTSPSACIDLTFDDEDVKPRLGVHVCTSTAAKLAKMQVSSCNAAASQPSGSVVRGVLQPNVMGTLCGC